MTETGVRSSEFAVVMDNIIRLTNIKHNPKHTHVRTGTRQKIRQGDGKTNVATCNNQYTLKMGFFSPVFLISN